MAKKLTKKLTYDMRKVFNNIDIFKQPLPSFNLKGQGSVSTLVGGFCTMLLFSIVLLYSTIKFLQLKQMANPVVSSYIKESSFGSDEILNMNERNFKVAFAVEGFRTKDLKYDPRYVKWIFRLYGKKNGKEVEKILPHHWCTEEDYAEFYPIVSS